MDKEVVLFFPCPQPPSPFLHCRVQDQGVRKVKKRRQSTTRMWISHSWLSWWFEDPPRTRPRLLQSLFRASLPLQSSWAKKVLLYLCGQMHSSLCSHLRWLQQGWPSTFLLRFPHTFSHQQTSSLVVSLVHEKTVALPLFQAGMWWEGKQETHTSGA